MEQDLENIVQELQMVSQQLVSVQTQVKELQGTIDHLKLQNPENAVFQQIGPLLVQVDDVEKLVASLTETTAQLNEHANKLTSREKELRVSYESAVQKFESM
jgi:chaperonin cofactor prefoldin